MSKKGFTLVELLAVIVILAIILAIAVPSVTSIINNSKASAYMNNEQMLLRAVKNYIGASGSGLPANIGDTNEIDLSTLQSNNYISTIKDPNDNSKSCDGYVLVTKASYTDYQYSPFLNCNNGAGTKASDGLVAYYPFDDFQEPTTNLINNPSGSTISNSNPGTYQPGWDASLHPDAIVVSNWTSGYNSGVTSPNIGYHAKWVYKNSNNTDPEMMFIDENNTYSFGHRWLGISQDVGNTTTLGIQAGQKLTLSWNQMSNVSGKGTGVGLYHTLISTGINSFESNTSTINVGNINAWERVSYTSTVSSDWDLTKDFNIYVYGYFGNYGRLWVDDVQLEKKDHVTPFVAGTRTGIIYDYSGNGNNTTLQLATTPQWVSTSKKGAGAYNFNGTSNSIEISDSPNLRMTTGGTISAWVYPKSAGGSGYGRIIDKSTGTSGDNGYLFSMMNSSLFFQVNASTGTTAVNNAVTLNQWNYVVVTFDSTGRKIYVNGVDVTSSGGTAIAVPPNVAGVVTIGNRSGATDRTFNGNIDDVKIYNRVLSAQEVNYIYQSEK